VHLVHALEVTAEAGHRTHALVIVGELQRTATASASPNLSAPLWLATGVLAALTLGSGMATLAHQRNYQRRLARPYTVDPAAASHDLHEQRSHLQNWLLATDVLAGLTVLTGGAAIYFSLRPGHGREDDRTLGTSAAGVTVGASGSF